MKKQLQTKSTSIIWEIMHQISIDMGSSFNGVKTICQFPYMMYNLCYNNGKINVN